MLLKTSLLGKDPGALFEIRFLRGRSDGFLGIFWWGSKTAGTERKPEKPIFIQFLLLKKTE
jgi:hypothetical protein